MRNTPRAGVCGHRNRLEGMRLAPCRCAALLWCSFCLLVFLPAPLLQAQSAVWHFAVSGDSRNCGDVVMPAIAKGALTNGAEFYWHLGDFRAIYRFDQDYAQEQGAADVGALSITKYLDGAWQDFIDNQLRPFGDTPVYLAFGNHELVPPMTKDHLLAAFSFWLNAPAIRQQRLKDGDEGVEGYYHWTKDGIDFLTLDNSSSDFDRPQMSWIERRLRSDEQDGSIRAVVVGMHEALPESISRDHSMNQTPSGTEHGRTVYQWLLDLKRKTQKPVYVLASHSHFYMEGIFRTEYWRTHGGELPGWIIGTAGAERYKLPPEAKNATAAKEHVYGYLLATVSASRTEPIRFEFKELKTSDVPGDVVSRFTQPFVDACWAGNPPVR